MRTFLDMTNEEIEFIVKLLFQTDASEETLNIQRSNSSIHVEMESFELTEGGYEKLVDNDTFVLKSNEIYPMDFTYNRQSEANRKYQQYLYSKGYHRIDQNNEFIEEGMIELRRQAEVGKIIIQAVEDDNINAKQVEHMLNMYRK